MNRNTKKCFSPRTFFSWQNSSSDNRSSKPKCKLMSVQFQGDIQSSNLYLYIMGMVKYAIWAIDRACTGHMEVLYGPYRPAAMGNHIHPRLKLQSHFTPMTFLNTSAFRASHLNNRQLQTQSIIARTQATSNQNMYSILSYCLPTYTFTVQLEKLKG